MTYFGTGVYFASGNFAYIAAITIVGFKQEVTAKWKASMLTVAAKAASKAHASPATTARTVTADGVAA